MGSQYPQNAVGPNRSPIMAEQVVVDTDILIDFGLDKADAVETMALLEQKYEMSVSVITAMELYTGCRSKKTLGRSMICFQTLRLIM